MAWCLVKHGDNFTVRKINVQWRTWCCFIH